MTCARAVVLAIVALVCIEEASASATDCPCLPLNATDEKNLTQPALLGTTVYQYPMRYGLGACATHDDGLAPWCDDGDDAASYCAQEWCYVDADLCHDSVYDYHASGVLPGRGLYYSYETCGGTDTAWEDLQVTSYLAGQTVRVAIPALSYPDHYAVAADGTPISGERATINHTATYAGVYIDLYKAASELGGFTIEWTTTSVGSLNNHDSSWTACVDDVSKGLVDLCIGNFWTTQSRLAMTTFTTPNDIDTFYMTVPRPKESSDFLDSFIKPFAPFTLDLWLCIIAMVVVVGVIKTRISTGGAGANDEDEDDRPPQHNKPQQPKRPGQALLDQLYHAIMAFLSGAVDPHEEGPKQDAAGPRLLNIGFGFFLLIVIASYTANLAALLSAKNLKTGSLNSMDDCIEQKCTLCVHSVMLGQMELAYGSTGVKLMAYTTDSPAGFAESARAPECDATMLDFYSFRVDIKSGDAPFLCDYYYVGSGLSWVPVAQPIRADLVNSVSFWLRSLVTSGEFSKMQAASVPNPPTSCDPFIVAEEEMDSAALNLKSMMSPFLICGVLAVSALILDAHFYGLSGTSAGKTPSSMRSEGGAQPLEEVVDAESKPPTNAELFNPPHPPSTADGCFAGELVDGIPAGVAALNVQLILSKLEDLSKKVDAIDAHKQWFEELGRHQQVPGRRTDKSTEDEPVREAQEAPTARSSPILHTGHTAAGLFCSAEHQDF